MAGIFKFTSLVVFCCILHTGITSAEPQPPAKEPNQPDYAKPIPPEKLKEDLDFLFKTIEEVHPNMYAYTSAKEFKPLKKQLYESVNRPMNQLEFYKLVAPVVALLKSFHTIILPFVDRYEEYSKKSGKVFPLELRWDGSNAILTKNYTSTFVPLGGKILKLNGRDATELFTSFSRWFAAENRNSNPWLIEHPVFLRALLLLEYGSVGPWDLRIKAADGATNGYIVPSLALSEFKTDQAIATIERKMHYRIIPGYNTAIIEFYKWREPERFKKFLDETFRDIKKKKLSNLIIDIRENTGGSDECVHMLMEYLAARPYKKYDRVGIKICSQTRERIAPLRREFPNEFASAKSGDVVMIMLPLQPPADNPFRFTGQTFVLISRRSFSASTVFASIVKCAQIATLIGEETGDPTTLFADSIEFKLPNSGLQAWVASKLLVCACGKPDGRGVVPNYEVKQTPEDTAKGVDTVLQFTLNLIKKSGSIIPLEEKQNNQVNQVQIERSGK